MADFDPDKFLAETAPASAAGGFDPDKFLSETKAVEARWGPTLDAKNTAAVHFARQVSGGLGDKIIAFMHANVDAAHDKSGRPWGESFGKAYDANLAFDDRLMNASDEAHPVARWVGNGAGFAGNLAALSAVGPAQATAAKLLGAAPTAAAAAPTLAQIAGQGAKAGAVFGAAGGFGADRSDSALGTAANTGLGAALGGGLGAAVPYAQAALGRGAQFLGGKAQALAGWLKIHSLHPTPTLAEEMAHLPGGEVEVGKELLRDTVGGWTKKGTAKQLEQYVNSAGQKIGDIAIEHDAAGGAPVNLDSALAAGRKAAIQLQQQPVNKAAGNKLSELMDEYEHKYSGWDMPAKTALDLKREIAEAAYSARKSFSAGGDTVSGKLGEGLSKFERAIDDSLDQHLGPEFGDANLRFRQLKAAYEAASRSAGRTQGNAHLLGGLVPSLVGGGVLAAGHGGPDALAYGLGASLLQKYGSQLGARALYSGAAPINLAGRAIQSGAVPGVAGGLAGPRVGTLADLLRQGALPDTGGSAR